jgi:hypothetical protein
MKPQACARCRGLEQWRIEPMLEHGFLGGARSRVPLAFKDDLAPLRTHVCHQCGFTLWYSGGAASLTRHDGRYRRIVDTDRPCRDCGGVDHYCLSTVHESAQAAEARVPLAILAGGSGTLQLVVCHGCGRVEWYVRAIAADAGAPSGDQCRHCLSTDRRAVASLCEDGGVPLPVAWQDERELGHFELRWCNRCGLCDWFGRDLDRLSAEGEYIKFIKAAPAPRIGLAGGPYR